jgi:hypothetical protein
MGGAYADGANLRAIVPAAANLRAIVPAAVGPFLTPRAGVTKVNVRNGTPRAYTGPGGGTNVMCGEDAGPRVLTADQNKSRGVQSSVALTKKTKHVVQNLAFRFEIFFRNRRRNPL